MNIKAKARIHNRFDIFRENVRTGKKEQIAQAENIILDKLWYRLFSNSNSYFGSIFFGSGSGELKPTNTGLFASIGSKSAGSPVWDYDHPSKTWSLRKQVTLSETEHQNKTFTEVGIGDSSYGLMTHALIQDMNGKETSFFKGTEDIITIYATVYAVIDLDSFDNGSIIVIDTKHIDRMPGLVSWLFRSATVTPQQPVCALQSACSPIRSRHGSTNTPNIFGFYTSGLTASYYPSTKSVKLSINRIPVGSGNAAGGYHGFWYFGGVFIDFTKLSNWGGSFIENEQIGTGDGSAKDFKTKYGLVKGTPIVKVNGVPDVSAVVDLGKPINDNLLRYFRHVECNDFSVLIGMSNVNYTEGGVVGTFNIVENPYNSLYGIDSVEAGRTKISISNDLVSWEVLGTTEYMTTFNVPTEYRKYKYFKMEKTGTRVPCFTKAISNDLAGGLANNVHLSFIPDVDDVITIDYTTAVVAKDTNHVFDFSFTIEVDEYTEPEEEE